MFRVLASYPDDDSALWTTALQEAIETELQSSRTRGNSEQKQKVACARPKVEMRPLWRKCPHDMSFRVRLGGRTSASPTRTIFNGLRLGPVNSSLSCSSCQASDFGRSLLERVEPSS